MAEKQFLVFVVLFGGQGFDFLGQRADAFYTDEKDRREHMFGVFAYGFADNGGQVCHDFSDGLLSSKVYIMPFAANTPLAKRARCKSSVAQRCTVSNTGSLMR